MTVVLHPRWHVVAPIGLERVVLVSGRYTYLGLDTGSGVLIDERSGKRVALAPPRGCYFDNANAAALGGSWVVARCSPPPPGPRYLYEFYSIPNRTWTPFTPNVKQMFAFNTDCKTGDPQCDAAYVAVGNRWIEFQITCGYHCGPTTFAFQNIQTGQVNDQPADWRPGGTQIPDLNSPTLARTLCKPLRVQRGFEQPDMMQTFPGLLVFYGSFGLLQADHARDSDPNYSVDTYIQRCGSSTRTHIDPSGWPVTANPHAVAWATSGVGKEIDGVFLPSLRRFTLQAPTGSIYGIVLTSGHLYINSSGVTWVTVAPSPKAS